MKWTIKKQRTKSATKQPSNQPPNIMTYGLSPPASAVKAPARRNLTAIGLFIVIGMAARLGGEKKILTALLTIWLPLPLKGAPARTG